MKKLILTILAFFIVLPSLAQIQKKIFGCMLGTTTYRQVEKILEKNYANPWFDGSRTVLGLNNIDYGGYHWYKVTFNFYKKVLYSVTLEGSNYTTSRKCSNDFSLLETDLRNRYYQFRTSDGYDDGTVVIQTKFFQNDERNYKSASITYEYKPFSKKKHQENIEAW